jgi:hypothetical protein
MRFIALIFGALAANSAVALAQYANSASWPPAVGVRTRILSPVLGREKQVGIVEAVTGDTLHFRRGEGMSSQALAPGQITMIEVPTGTHTATGKGALIGAVIGTAAGAAIGAAAYNPRPDCRDPIECSIDAAFEDTGRAAATIGGGIIGLVSGGLVGAWLGHRPRETWTSVAVPTR